MWPNPQFPADLVTFTEEILKGKLIFLCSDVWYLHISTTDSFMIGIIILLKDTHSYAARGSFFGVIGNLKYESV